MKIKTFIRYSRIPRQYRKINFTLPFGCSLFFDYTTRCYVIYKPIGYQEAQVVRKNYGIAIIQDNLSEFLIHVCTLHHMPTDSIVRWLQKNEIKGDVPIAMQICMDMIDAPTETEKKLVAEQKLMSEDMNKAADWFRKGGTMSVSLNPLVSNERKHGKKKEKIIFVGARSGKVLKIIER